MLSKTYSYGIAGLEAYPVTIEVDVSNGLPATHIVGLPDNAVKESKERVRSAIRNSGYKFSAQRITVNLSPAEIKKEGSSFDLAIALGILGATGQLESAQLSEYVILGQLSLDGSLKPVPGALSVAMSLPAGRFRGIILPSANAPEAAVVKNIAVYPAEHLKQVINFLQEPGAHAPFTIDIENILTRAAPHDIDLADVKGQYHVKRGLEIAAAGAHNILMTWTQNHRFHHGNLTEVLSL